MQLPYLKTMFSPNEPPPDLHWWIIPCWVAHVHSFIDICLYHLYQFVDVVKDSLRCAQQKILWRPFIHVKQAKKLQRKKLNIYIYILCYHAIILCLFILIIYPGSPTTIFYRLVSEPPFFIVRFIIFQKEPPFLEWWLTSRVLIY